MAIKASTGLRNALLGTGSFKGTMDGGFLDIYAGTVPTDADAAIGSATLLCRISDNGTGTGLDFAASAAAGVLAKDGSQVWSGTNVATGTATFYRFVASGDTGAASTTEPRLQGTVAVLGADLNLSSVALSSGAPQAIQFFYVALPG